MQDSGAQGSNFLARHVYDLLPVDLKLLSRRTNRIVRLGDSRSLFVHQEVPLTISILDSKGQCHSHPLWYSVLDVLSHEVIIGLVDLIGPYYDLFEDSIIASRKLALTTLLSNDLDSLTDQVNSFCQLTQQSAPSITENTQRLDLKQATTHSEHKYSGAAVNWDTYKQAAYGLYFAVTQFGYYVRGEEFILETDHRNLLWMVSSQVPIVIRWRVLLQRRFLWSVSSMNSLPLT